MSELEKRGKRSREACQVLQNPTAAYDEITHLQSEVERLASQNDKANNKNRELMAEVERLRGRCGELEDQLDRPRIALLKERTELRGRLTGCHQSIDAYVRDNERLQGLIDEADKATPALILRKQAEAVDLCHGIAADVDNPCSHNEEMEAGADCMQQEICNALDDYAQRLRQQADEAEKAGD